MNIFIAVVMYAIYSVAIGVCTNGLTTAIESHNNVAVALNAGIIAFALFMGVFSIVRWPKD